jgi:RNA polymerase sigma-70 factor (ECF subfamily)
VEDDVATMRASVTEPEQFEAIFDRHHGPIWAYLARKGGRELAEELASEVFLTAFAQRERYDPGRGSVRSWLYGIASHKARTRFRGQARATRALARLAARQRTSSAPYDRVDDALANKDQLDRVRQALAQLSNADQEVLVLFAWEHLAYDEIAAALGVEVGTVRSRLARARARLRELAGLSGELTGGRTRPAREITDG